MQFPLIFCRNEIALSAITLRPPPVQNKITRTKKARNTHADFFLFFRWRTPLKLITSGPQSAKKNPTSEEEECENKKTEKKTSC